MANSPLPKARVIEDYGPGDKLVEFVNDPGGRYRVRLVERANKPNLALIERQRG